MNKEFLYSKSKDGKDAFYYAIRIGKRETVEFLLGKDESLIVNENNIGQNTLHLVAIKGTKEMVEFLLEREEALLRFSDRNGHTPLQLACQNKKMIELLEQKMITKDCNHPERLSAGSSPKY